MNLKDSWQYNPLTPGNSLDTAILIIQSSWELRNSIIRREYNSLDVYLEMTRQQDQAIHFNPGNSLDTDNT
jgi:hypothetical protein